MDEIEGYQKIIDGVRQVVENYKPRIDVRPEWPMVEIGEICDLVNGRAFKPEDWQGEKSGGLPIIRIQNLIQRKIPRRHPSSGGFRENSKRS